jgi:methionine-rich copper-binding protein CopC
MFRHRLPRTGSISRMLAIAATVSWFTIAPAGLALAHSELIATSPAEDALLHKAPSQVRLTFGEDVLQEGSDIVVTGPGDTRYSDPSTLRIDGTIASIELIEDQVSGTYTVAYRIVSADGHVVEDSYTYELDLPGSTTSPSESTAATSPPAEEESTDAGSVWVPGLLAIGVVLVVAVIAVLVRRRRG